MTAEDCQRGEMAKESAGRKGKNREPGPVAGAGAGARRWGPWVVSAALLGVTLALVVTVHALNTQLNTAASSHRRLLQELEAEVSTAKAREAGAEEGRKAAASQVSSLSSKLSQAEEKVAAALESTTWSESLKIEAEARSSLLEGKVSELQAALGTSEATADALKTQLEALKQEREAAKAGAANTQEELHRLQEQRDLLTTAAQDDKRLLAELRARSQASGEALGTLQKAHQDLLARHQDLQDKARDEAERTRGQLEEAQKELAKEEADNKELKTTIQRLEVEAAAARDFQQSAQEKMDATLSYVAELEAKWHQAVEQGSGTRAEAD